jgi:hypothetical protein
MNLDVTLTARVQRRNTLNEPTYENGCEAVSLMEAEDSKSRGAEPSQQGL